MPFVLRNSDGQAIAYSEQQQPEYQWEDETPDLDLPVDLETLKERKIAELNQLCSQCITSGFESNALGTTHRYSAGPEQHDNLSVALALGISIPFTCTDIASGVKMQRIHSSEQLRQMGLDGAAHKVQKMQRYETLRLQILSASTHEEVQAVAWT